MKAVAKKLLQYKPQNVVIDPVMYAKNGCPLMNPTAVSTLIDTVIPLADVLTPVSYTHLRAHETESYLVCRLLLEKKKKK